MIDNLLLETTLPTELKVKMTRPNGKGRLRQVVQFDRVLGRNLMWTRAVGPGFWVGYQPDTHRCQVYLSVSRIHNAGQRRDARSSARHLVNFPLHDFGGIDGMDLQETSKEILWALGVRVSAIGTDYVRALNLAGWIVRRIAYAVDVEVPEVLPTIGALACAKRKRSSEVEVRGRPGALAHSATWTAGGVRVMLYSKGAELENRRAFSGTTFGDDAFGRAARSRLQEAAVAARNIIRFEVTYFSLDAIRRLLGIKSPMAPTFQLMAHHSISDYALGLEVDRLRLAVAVEPDVAPEADAQLVQEESLGDPRGSESGPENAPDHNTINEVAERDVSSTSSDDSPSSKAPTADTDFRALYDRFLRARTQRCPNMSLTRLGRIMMTFLLLTSFDRRELIQRGTKPSSLSKDVRDLARLGFMLGSPHPTVDQLARVDAFLDGLFALLPDLRIERPAFDATDSRLVTEVPWAPADESQLFKDAPPDISSDDFADVIDNVDGEQPSDEYIESVIASM